MKISFLIMTEYLKNQQVYSMLKMIEAAKAKNHEVKGVFVFGSGAINLPKKVELGKSVRNIPAALSEVTKQGIPVYACQTWADFYGMFPEIIVEGVEIVGLGELSNIAYESDKLIAFGARS